MEVLDVYNLNRQIRPIMESPLEIDDRAVDPGPLEGRISLEGVSFRYHPGQSLVLDDVSITAEPGQFIALAGPSGSGKSTILRLLLGFETPGSGRVSYDGRSLAELDVRAMRHQVGVVLPE